MELSGAIGVCCQKVSEAEAMVAGGVPDVLVSNEVAARPKARRLAALARAAAVGVCVDDAANAAVLSEEASGAGVTLRVLVDVNVGQNRCGVDGARAALELARHVAALPGLRFDGIQAYHGGIQHVRGEEERRAAARQVSEAAHEVVDLLREEGLACNTVTGGGTGTFLFDAGFGVYTEVQPGSYIFGDVDYFRNQALVSGGRRGWKQSLFVAATVVSRSAARAAAVADAGLKALSFDSGPPEVAAGSVLGGGRSVCSNGGDEHCVIALTEEGRAAAEGADAVLPKVGEVVRLVPGHCDPTVNMHSHLVGVRGDTVEQVFEITARGPGF